LSPPDFGWGPLKRRDGEPAFAEPWHAQALAMADLLVKSGQISAARWTDTLGSEIKASEKSGAADEPETYFRAVLSALERLLASDGRITRSELEAREHAWEHAYLSTPHGQPVKLG
jgi:nitrile hydratase accessory protein